MKKPICPPTVSLFYYLFKGLLLSPSIGKTWHQLMLHFGDVVHIHPFTKFYLINDLEIIQTLLTQKLFTKDDRFYCHLRWIFGDGLITNTTQWQPRRATYQPHFHPRILKQMIPPLLYHIHHVFDSWQIRQSKVIDLNQALLELVYLSSGHLLFNQDFSAEAKLTLKKIYEGNKALLKNTFTPRWLTQLTLFKHARTIGHLRDYLATTIDQHLKNPSKPILLDSLIELYQAHVEHRLTHKELIDEYIVFLITGHETTGSLLGWVWYLLSKHPEHLTTLYKEIDQEIGQRAITYEDLAKLPFLRMVLEETLRLYPPIWMLTRRNPHTTLIGKYKFPRNASLIICPYTLHRHPDYWTNPNHFDPYRFTKEQKQQRPKLSYLPFGSGPRTCIAASFAMLQASCILATLLQRFQITLLPNQVKEDFVITLKPEGAIPGQLVVRS